MIADLCFYFLEITCDTVKCYCEMIYLWVWRPNIVVIIVWFVLYRRRLHIVHVVAAS